MLATIILVCLLTGDADWPPATQPAPDFGTLDVSVLDVHTYLVQDMTPDGRIVVGSAYLPEREPCEACEDQDEDGLCDNPNWDMEHCCGCTWSTAWIWVHGRGSVSLAQLVERSGGYMNPYRHWQRVEVWISPDGSRLIILARTTHYAHECWIISLPPEGIPWLPGDQDDDGDVDDDDLKRIVDCLGLQPEGECEHADVDDDCSITDLDLCYGHALTYPRGDVNWDGLVNRIDLAMLGAHLGEPVMIDNCRFDVTRDGRIDEADRERVATLMGG